MKQPVKILALTLALAAWVHGEERVYKQPSDFIKGAFGGKIPSTSILSLSGDVKSRAKGIMAHNYPESRVRYWKQGSRSVWILEEIGKTQPITTGFLVENGRIKSVEILIYRESHGWEVSKPFFTKQFSNASLKSGDRLSAEVKNVAGATLSVRAVTKLARLALYFDSIV
ncbi:FMN-binding protein [Akkermansiaceae bacterium]|nr:FMN-binding protein [Akkermansiaceae bacterium]